MSFSEDTAKIHRWLLGRPKWIYRSLVCVYIVGLGLSINLAVVPNPIYGNRIFWLLDLGVLTAFMLSHVAYRWHNGCLRY